MNPLVGLILNSLLLGVALAMDAFSVSLATGFANPKLKIGRTLLTAGTFAFFQFAMPMIGWVCVHTIATQFKLFIYFIPWIALVLLTFIGGKMILEFIDGGEEEEKDDKGRSWILALFIQGIATSIDALSVGFDIYEYSWVEALGSSGIIAVVTFAICMVGLLIGKKFGMKLGKWAPLLGGVILLGIGLEIFISSMIEVYKLPILTIVGMVIIYLVILIVIEYIHKVRQAKK